MSKEEQKAKGKSNAKPVKGKNYKESIRAHR